MEVLEKPAGVQKYAEYKDSGVEWLGEIPFGWDTVYLGSVIELKSDKGHPNYQVLSVYRDYGVILKDSRDDNHNATALDTSGYKAVAPGDLVVNKMKAWQGSMGISNYKGIVSPAYITCNVRSDLFNSDYLHYLLRSHSYIGEYNRLSYGVRIGQWDMHYEDFKKITILIPPPEEQTAITNFLDCKTEQIDKAIEIKQKQIELLKERRQILIHKAVTRGLNPDVPLKPSGVEWIGEIPEHWAVKALKYIAYLESGNSITSNNFTEDGYPVYGGNGFRGYTNTYTNEGEFALIGRQGALCGNVNYARGKFFATEHAVVAYRLQNENILWLGEAIRLADFNRLSQSAAQPGISVNVVKNVKFPYPPISEQNEIGNYIKAIDSNVDKSIEFKRQQIIKLKEYKTTLINSAVTGKIRV
jgi:type I restriction enzyme S subunit